MENYFENPLQSEENGTHIDIPTKKYYPNKCGAQTITLPYGTINSILYDGFISYIPVRCPTPEGIDSCIHVALTLWNSWDPLLFGNIS